MPIGSGWYAIFVSSVFSIYLIALSPEPHHYIAANTMGTSSSNPCTSRKRLAASGGRTNIHINAEDAFVRNFRLNFIEGI